MEVEFQNTEKDYIDFNKIVIKSRLNRYSVIIAIILVFIVSIFSEESEYKLQNCLIATVVYLVIVAIYFYFFPLWKAKQALRKLISENKFSIEKRKLIITNEGLKTEGTGYNLLRSWESIKSIQTKQNFIQISFVSGTSAILSKKWFESDVEVGNFIGTIQSKIVNSSINSEQRYQNPPSTYSLKPKPFYWSGLLGFIPVIGAVFGIIFIINGIFKYKDKWVVAIGIGSILFTVLFYSWLNYHDTHDPDIQHRLVEISQTQLNSLVKELEFYKLQNGSYPDSLQQLDTKNSSLSIEDALLTYIHGGGHFLYYYHKIGNKYTLFSSGIDQKPNTSDDIYPSLDTSKTGLIIQRVGR